MARGIAPRSWGRLLEAALISSITVASDGKGAVGAGHLAVGRVSNAKPLVFSPSVRYLAIHSLTHRTRRIAGKEMRRRVL